MKVATTARRPALRSVTRAVLTPPGGKANNKQQQQPSPLRKSSAKSSALRLLSHNTEDEGGASELDRLGLYGRQPSALEQASSLTAAHRALLANEYDGDSESAPGLWEKLSGKLGDNRYMM